MGLMSTEPDLAKLIVANQDAFKALLTEKPMKPKAEKRPKMKMQSGPDGTCPLLMAAFAADAGSGDFYMPEQLSTGEVRRLLKV